MKIAWFTKGSRQLASSRLRAWMVAEALPPEFSSSFNLIKAGDEADIVVVQKLSNEDVRGHMERWLAAGKPVVWDFDDPVPFDPPDGTVITIPGEYFRPHRPTGAVVPGMMDVPPAAAVKVEHADKLRSVVWFGDPLNQRHATKVVEACKLLGLRMVLITDPDRAIFPTVDGLEYRRWSLETVDREITDCDVAALPYIPSGPDDLATLCKGEARLFKAWGLGMPVVGTPIQSSRERGLQNAATTVSEWIEELDRMRDVRVRKEDAAYGLSRTLGHNFCVTRAWVQFLNNLGKK